MSFNSDGLVCPKTLQPLSRAVDGDGNEFLQSGSGQRYPIINGIPRFVDTQKYVGSFGFQWNEFDVKRDGEDRDIFKVKTSWNPEDLRGKRVLDAGCGGGRYAYLLGKAGAQLDGIDLSQAVEKARSQCADMPNVRISQGDLFHLPYKDKTFDYVYSIGVIHHSPSTKIAFKSIAKMVKPGGQLAVWVYRKNTLPQEIINTSIRSVTSRLPHQILKPITFVVGAGLGGIPIVNKTVARVVSFGSSVPDWRLRACDAFDWYSPRYQYHHSPDEVKKWFEEEGFSNIQFLRPQKSGKVYDWAYDHNLLNGSGVNFVGTKI